MKEIKVNNINILLISILIVLMFRFNYVDNYKNNETNIYSSIQLLAHDAEREYINGNFVNALSKFYFIKKNYSYSQYILLADLRIGDSYIKLKQFNEAFVAYDNFIRLYNKHKAVPYVLYNKGIICYSQMLLCKNDFIFMVKSIDLFSNLIIDYPRSKWSIKAKIRLKESIKYIVEYNMFIGNFYMNTSMYNAAMMRYKYVLTQYPDIGFYNEATNNYKIAKSNIN